MYIVILQNTGRNTIIITSSDLVSLRLNDHNLPCNLEKNDIMYLQVQIRTVLQHNSETAEIALRDCYVDGSLSLQQVGVYLERNN